MTLTEYKKLTGLNFQQLANALGVSIGTVHRHIVKCEPITTITLIERIHKASGKQVDMESLWKPKKPRIRKKIDKGE